MFRWCKLYTWFIYVNVCDIWVIWVILVICVCMGYISYMDKMGRLVYLGHNACFVIYEIYNEFVSHGTLGVYGSL